MLLMHGGEDQSRQSSVLTGPDAAILGEKLTRLKDEGASDIHVPTVTCWFDTLIGAQ